MFISCQTAERARKETFSISCWNWHHVLILISFDGFEGNFLQKEIEENPFTFLEKLLQVMERKEIAWGVSIFYQLQCIYSKKQRKRIFKSSSNINFYSCSWFLPTHLISVYPFYFHISILLLHVMFCCKQLRLKHLPLTCYVDTKKIV